MQNFTTVLHFFFEGAFMDTEMACEGKSYSGVSLHKMDYIRRELKSLGLHVADGHEGRIHGPDIGVEAEFRYTHHEEELFFKVHQKPFFVPCALIFQRLEVAMSNYQGPDAPDLGPDPF